MWGKCKTVSQMSSVIYILASQYFLSVFSVGQTVTDICNIITDIVLWTSALLTVISGIVYVKQNKEFIDPKK